MIVEEKQRPVIFRTDDGNLLWMHLVQCPMKGKTTVAERLKSLGFEVKVHAWEKENEK